MANEYTRYNKWVASGRRNSPAMSPEEKALQDYLNAGNEFIDGGAAKYEAGTPLTLEQLQSYDQLGPTALGNIQNDPKYREYEMEALRQLEQQSQKGFNARDEADLARVEQQANRANKGRQGAIQQSMQARGLAGSGLEYALAQQSAQDSAEMEALAGLEKNAQMMERKQSAAERLGSLGSQLQQRDYAQEARKAEAQDAISRFNTANSIQRQQANNQIANQQAAQNWGRANETGDRNTAAQYDFSRDKLGVQQSGAQMAYNKATDDWNRSQIKKQQRDAKRRGLVGGVLGAAGAVTGGVLGTSMGPMGTMAGASAGYQAGNALGGAFAKGGRVPGASPFPGDSEMNDIFSAQLSPGEIVLPRTIADNPDASAAFVAATNQGMDPMAAKYVAQTASQTAQDDEALAKNAPFYPTPDGKPIPVSALAKPQPGPRTKQSSRPPVIAEPILQQLEASRPDLVAEYRKKMAAADEGVRNAEEMQGYMGLANLAGKAFTDFANSQKEDVILKNRMQDLGKAPTVSQAQRSEYDGSMLDKLAAQQVASAKGKRDDVRQGFDEEQKLSAYASGERMKDPNSAESKSARAFLRSVLPISAKTHGIDSMSAAQLEKVSPMLMEKWKADRAQANADRDYKLKEREITAKASEKKKLSGDEQKVVSYAAANLKAIQDMRKALANGDNTFTVYGDNNFTEAARRAAENFGRLQSGGAINKDEEARLLDMLPRSSDSKEMKATKLANIEAEMNARITGLGESPEQQLAMRGSKPYKEAPSGQRVRQNGITFVWDGSNYVPEE